MKTLFQNGQPNSNQICFSKPIKISSSKIGSWRMNSSNNMPTLWWNWGSKIPKKQIMFSHLNRNQIYNSPRTALKKGDHILHESAMMKACLRKNWNKDKWKNLLLYRSIKQRTGLNSQLKSFHRSYQHARKVIWLKKRLLENTEFQKLWFKGWWKNWREIRKSWGKRKKRKRKAAEKEIQLVSDTADKMLEKSIPIERAKTIQSSIQHNHNQFISLHKVRKILKKDIGLFYKKAKPIAV